MRIAMTVLLAGLFGAAGCSNLGIPPSSADTTQSTDLKQGIEKKLAANPQLARVSVSADATQNLVTLSGSVSSEEARSAAVAMAKSSSANPTIVDKIEVSPDGVARSAYTDDMARDARQKAKAVGDRLSQSLDDTWIYTKIETKLAGQSANSALKIHVDVFQHEVTLRGEVDSPAAKAEAERIAKETEGVRLVNNLLTVKS